jgi:hypothetical protein
MWYDHNDPDPDPDSDCNDAASKLRREITIELEVLLDLEKSENAIKSQCLRQISLAEQIPVQLTLIQPLVAAMMRT